MSGVGMLALMWLAFLALSLRDGRKHYGPVVKQHVRRTPRGLLEREEVA